MKLPEVIAVEAVDSPRTVSEVLERYRGTVVNQANMRSLKEELLRVMRRWVARGELLEVPNIWVVHHLREPGAATVLDEEGIRMLVDAEYHNLSEAPLEQLLMLLREGGWEIV